MPNVFAISDPHLGHENILTFTREDGSRVRNFDNVDQMHEYMLDKWNGVVRPQDKVYVLGDVAMHKRWVEFISKFNGHKRLVRGNHDVYPTKEYLKYFDEVYAYRVLDNMIFSHIPIHPDSLGRFGANVHGHVHNNLAALSLPPRYINVSVEVIDYTPVSLEDLKWIVQKRLDGIGV